ncbi:hypothetical protein A0O21_05815 [Streptococcus pantholopis]|uniref:Uncharacterized protein n=1 Tax=Streptococcus pantholopis TaxID=1811193 RepID=A0A172Q7Y7_9STRE|nr:hypothetical protein A0O21_05815 [Streptococcus pantholopis]
MSLSLKTEARGEIFLLSAFLFGKDLFLLKKETEAGGSKAEGQLLRILPTPGSKSFSACLAKSEICRVG